MNLRNGKIAGRKRIIVAALISLAIVVLLAWKAGVRVEVLGEQLRRLDWTIVAVTLVFSALWHVFVGADKWWRIMRAQGAGVGYWEVFRVRLGSDPIRFAAPMKAGEIVNAVYFARLKELGFSRAAGSIVFDKSLNFFGTVFWLYVGVAAMAELPAVGYLGLHTVMGAAVLVLVCVRPVRQAATALAAKIHPKLGRLATGVLSAFEEFSPLKKIGFLLYGIVFQLRPLAVCGLSLAAFGPERLPSIQELLGLGSVVVLMSNIPSLGGIGPREAALMAAFAGYADQSTLLSAGLLMSLAVQVFPATLGLPLMFPLLEAVTPGGAEAEPKGVREAATRAVVPEPSAAEVSTQEPSAISFPPGEFGPAANDALE
jgi:hypothetical protein